MTRFDRALVREMVSLSTLSLTALMAIYAVVLMVRFLGRAALGDMEAGAILPLLGFAVLRFLPILMSLALFIGVFMSLTRVWRDSEAVIWMGAGVGPLGWVRPVLLFALPACLLIGVFTMEGLPWAARAQAQFERDLKADKDEVSSLAPGVFTEAEQGSRVYFVEHLSEDGLRVENVFVQAPLQGRMGVVTASRGHVETRENGEHYLVLEEGRRYDGVPGEADFRVASFSKYAVRMPAPGLTDPERGPRTQSLTELLEHPSPAFMGELVWRLGHPLCALLLCLLAVPLSYVNPRAGKSLNVVFAILIYNAYNNFVGVSEQWVSEERLSAAAAVVSVHGFMAGLILLLFWHRFRGPWAG